MIYVEPNPQALMIARKGDPEQPAGGEMEYIGEFKTFLIARQSSEGQGQVMWQKEV